ncbi:MAG: thiamine diphosphokinase [Paracoccaceae bacterium]
MIVSTNDPITLIGGGASSDSMLRRARAFAPDVVAADGGAAVALSHGVMPRAVIGDMDSISGADRAALGPNRIFRIDEQDSTDFDKCLRSIAAPLILGVGFLGARVDHHLAACNSLVRHPYQRCVLLGDGDVTFLAPPQLRIDLPAGCVFSLFPMGTVTGESQGLQWPVQGLTFAPDGRVGTSNRALGAVDLSVSAPNMLVILPEKVLPSVVDALRDAPVWPV